jgi:hypothetical protein
VGGSGLRPRRLSPIAYCPLPIAQGAQMKTASPALIAFLNAARANSDAPIAFAECFAFTLATGATLAYANVDQSVVYNGLTYAADGPLVQGLKFRSSVGLEVDKQQIVIAARPTDRPDQRRAVSRSFARRRFRRRQRPARSRVHDRARPTADRRRDAVQGPRVDHRLGRPHQRDDHRRL